MVFTTTNLTSDTCYWATLIFLLLDPIYLKQMKLFTYLYYLNSIDPIGINLINYLNLVLDSSLKRIPV